LEEAGGMLLGQCVTAVGWIGGTVPDCRGIVEIPMSDVAAPGFAVGCALMGKRPIFVVRYQGFMWYNCSSFVNYAARSKQVWGVPVPIFIRAIGMEGQGVGHTASSSLHSLFMHPPGLLVAAPMTPGEYQQVWDFFMDHDDPIYVSEHRRSFPVDHELADEYPSDAQITVFAISAARLNVLEARDLLAAVGIAINVVHVLWLKPFQPAPQALSALAKTRQGLVIDSDFQICGAAESLAFELSHKTGIVVHALGLEDRVCGVAKHLENITPSGTRIAEKIRSILGRT
jgi:pyruvate dehydrogenase E1 component beta subunit